MRKIRKAVVSGATSFLGSAVVKQLVNQGCEVYGLVRPESTSRGNLPDSTNFHEVLCEITDTETWGNVVGQADTYFHFAWGGPGVKGRADPDAQRQSAEFTEKCIRKAADLGVQRVFLSGSQAEYGQVYGITRESTPCNPISEYGKRKLEISRKAPILAAEAGMEYVHARFFSVYGMNDHPYALIPSCIRCFLSGDVMELSDCSNKWNFLHVRDAAAAAVKLAECDLKTQATIVNVASTDTRLLREYVDEIHLLTGRKGVCAYGALHRAERPVDNWPDISKLQGMIDWQPEVTFAQGVSELIREEERKRREGGEKR